MFCMVIMAASRVSNVGLMGQHVMPLMVPLSVAGGLQAPLQGIWCARQSDICCAANLSWLTLSDAWSQRCGARRDPSDDHIAWGIHGDVDHLCGHKRALCGGV